MRNKFIFFIFIMGLACLTLSACHELSDSRYAGRPIQFDILIDNTEFPITKTSYSGVVDPGSNKERIDWVKGDELYIDMYCYNPNLQWDYKNIERTYRVVNIEPNGEKSIGNISSDNPFVWPLSDQSGEYVYDFYSIYPSNFKDYESVFDLPNPYNPNLLSLKFCIPSKQSGDMSLAYMAAASTGHSYREYQNQSVVLQYYPMITTLWLVLTNDTPSQSEMTVNNIKLTSIQDDTYYTNVLSGAYPTTLTSDGFKTNDTDQYPSGEKKITLSVNKTVQYGKSIAVPLFIRPREYKTKYLNLSITTTIDGANESRIITHPLGENKNNVTTLAPCKKYNIYLNLSGNGEPVIEGRLPLPAAQMMLSIIMGYGGGSDRTWPAFEEFFREYFEFETTNEFLDKFWNPFYKEYAETDQEDMSVLLDKWFPDKKFDGLLDLMSRITEIDLSAGAGANGKYFDILTKEDFSIYFKSVKTIKLLINKNVTINLIDLEFLEEVIFTAGSNGNVTLVIEGNKKDVKVTKEQDNHKVTVNGTEIQGAGSHTVRAQ